MAKNTDLPRGWFSPGDIRWYREIYADLVGVRSYSAEVGCYRGRSICAVKDIVCRKRVTVHCVDLWEPFAHDADPHTYEDFIRNVAGDLYSYLKLWKMASVLVAQQIPDNWLDFVFIDADHDYESVKADIEAWEPKVVPMGWIGGHDYNEWAFPGVNRAVNERYGSRVLTRMDSTIWLVQKRTA
jgi:hypothetical protein